MSDYFSGGLLLVGSRRRERRGSAWLLVAKKRGEKCRRRVCANPLPSSATKRSQKKHRQAIKKKTTPPKHKKNSVLHRDLKPQNLLIDRTHNLLKLADFGLARAFGLPVRAYTHEVVTLWYRAPEVLLGAKAYSTPVDVWSIGCIFVEMANGRPLFPGDSVRMPGLLQRGGVLRGEASEGGRARRERRREGNNNGEERRTARRQRRKKQTAGDSQRRNKPKTLEKTKKQEIDELYKIFMTLGTPDEAAWPGVTSLPEYQADAFPKWRARPLSEVCPSLCAEGLDLLSRMLAYDPQRRVTARMALQHSYFSDIPSILDDPPRL